MTLRQLCCVVGSRVLTAGGPFGRRAGRVVMPGRSTVASWVAERRRAVRTVAGNRPVAAAVAAWCTTVTADSAAGVGFAVVAYQSGGLGRVATLEVVRSAGAALLGPLLARWTPVGRPAFVLWVVAWARMAIMATLALFGTAPGAFGVLATLAVLDAILYSRYWPAQSSLVAGGVRTLEELAAANVVATVAENLGSALGPAMAAGVLLGAGGQGVFLACAVLFVLSATALARGGGVRTVPPRPVPTGGDLRAAVRVLRHEAGVGPAAALYLTQVAALGALGVLSVAVAAQMTGLGDAGVGVLVAVQGVGGVLGSLLSLSLVGRRKLSGPLIGAPMAFGAAILMLGLSPAAAPACGVLLCAGAAAALGDVAGLTVFQRLIRARMLDPVLTLVEGLWFAAAALGAAGAGLVAARLGSRETLCWLGLGLLGVVGLLASRLRGIDEALVGPTRELELLGRMPWFRAQPPLMMERLALDLRAVEVTAGQVVITRDAPGDRMYLIEQGTVNVAGRLELGPGDWFGEVAILFGTPRNATVRAVTDCVLFALDGDDLMLAINRGGSHVAAAAALAHPPPPPDGI